MIYLRNVAIKLLMLPLAVLFFIPAYLAFVFDDEYKRFHYKLEK